MSKYFVENTEESIKDIFRKKQVYKSIARSPLPNLVDFTFAEKALYGRVNRRYLPITPNENVLAMANLSSGTPNSVRVFNFVADAFRDLQSKFRIKAASGEIDLGDDFLTDIVPAVGYIDPHKLYKNYQFAYIIAMGNIIKNKKLKFSNFDEFIEIMFPYIVNCLRTKVFTFSAFIKSKDCPINASGLVVEIGSKISSNNDQFKYDKFYKSRNWDFFLNACNTYGFMVDCNMPNRLVADIASPAMIEKMRLYDENMNNTDSFLYACYDAAAFSDFSKFKRFFYDLYNENKPDKVVISSQVDPMNMRTEIREIESYTYSNFLLEYGDEYFFKLYSKIRFMEEESIFTDSQQRSIQQNILEVMKFNQVAAFSIFETILNKTFDYNGSLSYITNRQNLLRR